MYSWFSANMSLPTRTTLTGFGLNSRSLGLRDCTAGWIQDSRLRACRCLWLTRTGKRKMCFPGRLNCRHRHSSSDRSLSSLLYLSSVVRPYLLSSWWCALLFDGILTRSACFTSVSCLCGRYYCWRGMQMSSWHIPRWQSRWWCWVRRHKGPTRWRGGAACQSGIGIWTILGELQ